MPNKYKWEKKMRTVALECKTNHYCSRWRFMCNIIMILAYLSALSRFMEVFAGIFFLHFIWFFRYGSLFSVSNLAHFLHFSFRSVFSTVHYSIAFFLGYFARFFIFVLKLFLICNFSSYFSSFECTQWVISSVFVCFT